MNSDSATTRTRKEHVRGQLTALGFMLPKWFIEGATVKQLEKLLRYADEAGERYAQQER